MTSPEALWDKALDCLRRTSGVQGVTASYPDNGNTARPVVDKSGTVVHEEAEQSICRAVVINDVADLDAKLAKMVADFRLDLAIEELPPIAYIRGSAAGEQVFSLPDPRRRPMPPHGPDIPHSCPMAGTAGHLYQTFGQEPAQDHSQDPEKEGLNHACQSTTTAKARTGQSTAKARTGQPTAATKAPG